MISSSSHPLVSASSSSSTLTFRRADGTTRDYVYEESHRGIVSLHTLSVPAGYNHHMRFSGPMPRNVQRLFRTDNDEPARAMYFLRDTRRAICRDGQDRTCCSSCGRGVACRQRPATQSDLSSPPPHRATMMSPPRVFRDLLMSDVGEPLRPAVRDALLAAVHAQLSTDPWQKRVGRMAAPLPPPASSSQSFQNTAYTDKMPRSPAPAPPEEQTFYYFSRLPFEIRQLIWELALPQRVLLRDELVAAQHAHRAQRLLHMRRPLHARQELWRSDLFYTCVEARRVIEAMAQRQGQRWLRTYSSSSNNQHGSSRNWSARPPPAPLEPVTMTTTALLNGPEPTFLEGRLQAGLDMLYFPWKGSNMASGKLDPVVARGDGGYGDGGSGGGGGRGMSPGYMSSACRIRPRECVRGNGGLNTTCATADNNDKKDSDADTLLEAAARFANAPYSHWASQLRTLGVSLPCVALDVAWLDKGHADTVAWAVGVDLDEDEVQPGRTLALQPLSRLSPTSPPSVLQVVVADIVLPLRVRLDSLALAPAHRQLLRQHVSSCPPLCSLRRVDERLTSGPLQPNLQGMDLTVLADLYDDWRIDELLSLANVHAGADADADQSRCSLFNKAAAHRCIACTRAAWEERRAPVERTTAAAAGASSSSPPLDGWTRKFGMQLGTKLRALCRPTIVFSVVLEFEGVW